MSQSIYAFVYLSTWHEMLCVTDLYKHLLIIHNWFLLLRGPVTALTSVNNFYATLIRKSLSLLSILPLLELNLFISSCFSSCCRTRLYSGGSTFNYPPPKPALRSPPPSVISSSSTTPRWVMSLGITSPTPFHHTLSPLSSLTLCFPTSGSWPHCHHGKVGI